MEQNERLIYEDEEHESAEASFSGNVDSTSKVKFSRVRSTEILKMELVTQIGNQVGTDAKPVQTDNDRAHKMHSYFFVSSLCYKEFMNSIYTYESPSGCM